MDKEYQNTLLEYIEVGAPFQAPLDTTEVLRLCGDPLIVEAAMRHFMSEYEISPERGDLDAGTDLEGEGA